MKGNSFFYSNLKVVIFVAALVSLECFTFSLLGLSHDLDDSIIFKFCFEYFSKDSFMYKCYFKDYKVIYLFIYLDVEDNATIFF